MSDKPAIRAHLGKVLIPRHDREDGWVDDEYTPDAARRLIRELIAAIHVADYQVVAIRAACLDGHQWGDGWNSVVGDKHTTYHCTRDGCQGSKREPGWLPFEPKDHHVPYAGVRPCTGPGCDYCSNEAMAGAMRDMFDKALEGFGVSKRGVMWPFHEEQP